MSRLRLQPECLIGLTLVWILVSSATPARADRPTALTFAAGGHTFYGDWRATVTPNKAGWAPGDAVRLAIVLQVSDTHVAGLAGAGIKADKLCVLVTAERTFDATGWMRLPSDERMSTLLTPAGLAIEGGVQGAVTNRYGYPFKSPLDQFVSLPAGDLVNGDAPGTRAASFEVNATLPADLPPGLYRLRFDFGVMVGTRVYNLNGYTFAARPFSSEAGTVTYFYSPIIPASGPDATGRSVSGSTIQARFPWVLLSNYNSNGYRGVVADEDRSRFALSDRSLINDVVILPMYDDNGNRVSYSLEPQFPTDTIDSYQNIAWDWSNGELSVKITAPDGSTSDLGMAKFVAKSGNGPTTKASAFTAWKPAQYGRYTVVAKGWIADGEGRRYEGGGTYRFWIAKRMTLATATFQGMPYPVGSTYGRDTQFNPAVPADVTVTASLYVDSDPGAVRTLTYSGKATTAGLFGAAQGMKSFPLDAPGEYHAQVLATYTDPEGHLWVSTMRHAGVVYPESSPVVARGKKFSVGGKYVERGETKFEGYVEADGTQHLAHITFPYQAGDVLLIGAEGQGANKIEPVLTYQMQGDTSAWDTTLNGVGTTNLRIKTSNGYSPHLYPEYITDLEYYYGAAPRPGFMGRFIVGESNVRAPYWPVSPNSFGGQIGASANGDAPGDIYRLLGGVVLRRQGQGPMYSGYIASAFLLPKGSNNNRVVAAGSEDLYGPLGKQARFFLVGLRPGTAYEAGSTFRPAMQIDPILPVSIRFTLTYPDGRQQVAEGSGDRFGSFAGSTAWPLDVTGVYKYRISASWNGFQGGMPGLPDDGGEFYVYSKTRPAGASGLRLDGATQRTFSATSGLTITGSSSASVVHYALITPGAVIEQGDVEVKNGKFSFVFDPGRAHAAVPLYDIVSITTGKPQIGRVIHLTFFSEEKTANGAPFFDFVRVILRGTTAISARGLIPSTTGAGASGTSAAGGIASVSDTAHAGGTATEPAEPIRSGTTAVRVQATTMEGLRDWDRRIDQLVANGELRIVRREVDTVLAGRIHERLQQYHQDVPVFGADVTRQTVSGLTVSAFGVVYPDIAIETTPVLDAEQAHDIVGRRTGGRIVTDVTKLVVLARDEGGYALAWRTEARTGTDVIVSFVDATTGALLLEHNNLKTQQPTAMTTRARGVLGDEKTIGVSVVAGRTAAVDVRQAAIVTTLDLRGDVARTASVVAGTVVPGAADVATAAGGAWSDPAVVDAHANLASASAFLLERFGRRGVDGHDAPITAMVHPVNRDDWGRLPPQYDVYFVNAFWDGQAIVFGEGVPAGATVNGRSWTFASAALDVAAHELAHGVDDHAARLLYRGESGALSEAFADILGTAAEFWAQPAGTGVLRADYLIGEDAATGGLRSLADPAVGGYPDHYTARDTGTGGNGDARINSTIAGHAYYLAIEGGTNRTSGLAVEGVGRAAREQVEKAFYRAFVYLLPSNATFSTARAATVQAARDLYGAGSRAEQAMTQAWTAVGVVP